MKSFKLYIIAGCMLACSACRNAAPVSDISLAEKLYEITDTVPGTVGIAFVSDNDTVTVNNGVPYPMMSVFKLHQALVVAKTLADRGQKLDSVIHVSGNEVDTTTWSPVIKQYMPGDFDISVSELIKGAIVQSDNNASNLLFSHIVSPTKTDTIVKSIAGSHKFHIGKSEAEMKANPMLSYLNCTSPLSAAVLIRQVFEQPLVKEDFQDSIRQYLSAVTTGKDRLGSAVQDSAIELFGHKTGSGFRNEIGDLMAHNDVGYFRLADGRSYALAVFIRDFRGTEAEASKVIADISKCVYEHFSETAP